MSIVKSTINVVSPLAVSLQLTQSAMAHNGELHGQKKEAVPEEPQPNNTGLDPIDSSDYVPDSSAEVTTVESVVEADVPDSLTANLSVDSFPIGLGEILFSLILIFPWLLITLRKQLHLSTRS
jgi:hypothetical protein